MTRSVPGRRIAALPALAIVLASCGGGGELAADPADRVRGALAATSAGAWSLTYEFASPEHEVEVRLRLKDAFRYHALVVVNGVPAVEETVVDDTVALRLLDRSAAAHFPGTVLPPALAAGQWVVDMAGAPDPLAPRTTDPPLPEKAIGEALAVFATAERWVEEANEVVRFNPNAVEYRPDEDPFPVPPRGSSVIRYDSEAPPLPASNPSRRETPVPSANHLRRVAFYLRGGKVIAMRAAIDVTSRLVDIERVYGFTLPDDRPLDEVADAALRALNRIRVGQGNEPINPGRWDVEVEPLAEGFDVALPAGAVEAKLGDVLVGSAKEPMP